MSGLWGYQSALDLYLQENGITTLLFGGVNTDQVFSVLCLFYKYEPVTLIISCSALGAPLWMHTFGDMIAY